MNYTSIEQSKRLLDLGLNPDTADMHYLEIIRDNDVRYIPELLLDDNECDIPCWSLGALVKLMPKVISIPANDEGAYFYGLEWQFANDNSLRYIATNRSHCLIDIYSDHDLGGKSFVETAFEMVVWLLKNNYIKTEKQ